MNLSLLILSIPLLLFNGGKHDIVNLILKSD